MPFSARELIKKIQTLPPDQLIEIKDFVDFIRRREQERALTRDSSAVSVPSFSKIWNNPEDGIYDAL